MGYQKRKNLGWMGGCAKGVVDGFKKVREKSYSKWTDGQMS